MKRRIVAVLLTDFTTSPAVVFSFTTTSKLTETSPFAGTTTLFHVIVPFSLSKFPFSVIVPEDGSLLISLNLILSHTEISESFLLLHAH